MKRLAMVLCLFALFLSPAWVVGATTWDVTADFSLSSNPNGVWSYGWSDGTLHLYDTASGQWYDSGHHGGDYTPTIWKNVSSSMAYGVLPGEVSLHPGSSGEWSVARWTSPISGTVTINGWFGAGDLGSMSYAIYENGKQEFYKPYASGNESFNLTAVVTSGTTIDFMVGEAYAYGNTPLHATIATVVPIPSAILLLGPGLFGFAAIRRRFKI